jgi:hypothetical protein
VNLLLDSQVPGLDGYTDKSAFPSTFDNHYPFQIGVSDFLLYDIGDFEDLAPVANYDADTGLIESDGSGQEKVFEVEITGFSRVHFDVYGYGTKTNGQVSSDWTMNSGSHDATYLRTPPTVPAPAAVLFGGVGLVCLRWIRSRRYLRT